MGAPVIDKNCSNKIVACSSSMATLKGIFPNPKPACRKNFIHENVKNLRRMEQFFHTKDVEDFQKLQLQKKSFDKYQNVASRINSSLRNGKHHVLLGKPATRHSDKDLSEDGNKLERKVSAPVPSKTVTQNRKSQRSPLKFSSTEKSKKDGVLRSDKNRNIRMQRTSSDPKLTQEPLNTSDVNEKDSIRYRSQGIQTLDTDDVAALYRDGVIRYPSSRGSKSEALSNRNIDRSVHHECPSSPSDRGDTSPASPRRPSFDQTDSQMATGDQISHVKLNKQKVSVASKLATQLNNGVPPANYRKGVVPKYIRERKEAQQQRDEKIKAAAALADCPDGHVPLPDDERKKTLQMLKKHHQDYVNELNMMPIKTDTLRSQQRKMEIEKQLNKLEEGMKVFSRPKVYVKVNA